MAGGHEHGDQLNAQSTRGPGNENPHGNSSLVSVTYRDETAPPPVTVPRHGRRLPKIARGRLRVPTGADTSIQVDTQVLADLPEPAGDEIARAIVTLKLLADETRLRIVWNLLHGEHNVNELAVHLDMQPATISYHLAKLRLAGVVRTRRDGNRIYYAAHDRYIERLVVAAFRHAEPAEGSAP
jgi:DNA-binding transcriptional ArsR family regulator